MSSSPSNHQTPRPRLLPLLVWLWVVVTIWLGYEYLILNGHLSRSPSFLKWLHQHRILFSKQSKISPEPGEALSWWLGWIGFGLICLTNVYIVRRKMSFRSGQKQNLTPWLDTHIFLGLLGPTLIVFHCNFKVRGLVAISFWSMIVCFVSGVVGRYFYVQLLKDRASLKSALRFLEKGFGKILQESGQELDKRLLEDAKASAFVYAGGSEAMLKGQLPVATVLYHSIVGDLRLLFGRPLVPFGLPPSLSRPLTEYALILRRFYAGKYFRKLMGYWHAFHKPFAIFMYVVTVIHIAAVLVFRVKTP